MADVETGDITLLLRQLGAGDPEAAEKLYRAMYAQLHDQAERLMGRVNADHTLQATALLNEAYLKLVNRNDREWANRRQFIAVTVKAMRSVLVDHARARRAQKRGGEAERTALDPLFARFEDRAGDILDLEEALGALRKFDPDAAEVVELRFFMGLTGREAAEVVGVSEATVKREWEVARAWLRLRLS